MEDNQKIFSMLLEDMKEKGQFEIVDLLRKCDYKFDENGYDNWDGGMYYFTLYIYLRLPVLNELSDDRINTFQEVILNSAKRFFNEDHISLSQCCILPYKELFIDWDSIIEHCTPEELIDHIDKEQKLLIESATGTPIDTIDDEYKNNHQKLIYFLSLTKAQNLVFSFNSLWEWHSFYKNDNKEDLSQYTSRRKYVSEKYSHAISLLQNSYVRDARVIKRPKTNWNDIENSLSELNIKVFSIKDKMTFNEIGVRCRETIIALANKVYHEEEHFPFLSPEKQKDSKGKLIEHISDTDSYRKLDCVINSVLNGDENSSLRKYAKSTIDLANSMTHTESSDFIKARLCISATICLVDMIYSLCKK